MIIKNFQWTNVQSARKRNYSYRGKKSFACLQVMQK